MSTAHQGLWCERRDSNSHAFRRQNLNLVRLPISPLSQWVHFIILGPAASTGRASVPSYRIHNNRLITRSISADAKPPAVAHYENFPVASWLLPTDLRGPVRLIYAFARQADDFADEGTDPPEMRIARLASFGRELDAIERGEGSNATLFQQ